MQRRPSVPVPASPSGRRPAAAHWAHGPERPKAAAAKTRTPRLRRRARPGPAALVAAAWEGLGLRWRWDCERHESQAPGTPYPDLLALYAAASAAPRLRRLHPYTSHFGLHFSSCTDFPWERQGGFIVPLRTGGFQVYRREPTEVIAETRSADEAVALAVALLPPGPGPEITLTR